MGVAGTCLSFDFLLLEVLLQLLQSGAVFFYLFLSLEQPVERDSSLEHSGIPKFLLANQGQVEKRWPELFI